MGIGYIGIGIGTGIGVRTRVVVVVVVAVVWAIVASSTMRGTRAVARTARTTALRKLPKHRFDVSATNVAVAAVIGVAEAVAVAVAVAGRGGGGGWDGGVVGVGDWP